VKLNPGFPGRALPAGAPGTDRNHSHLAAPPRRRASISNKRQTPGSGTPKGEGGKNENRNKKSGKGKSKGKGGSKGKKKICRVPKLEGETLKAAERSLGRANCKLGKVLKHKSPKTRKGLVVSSRPGAGTKHPAGTRVGLTLGG
jgi:hypothetical protein